MKPELLVECACATGECPMWHSLENRVYWVDIPAGTVYRHDPATGATETFDAGAAVGGFTIQPDGRLLLFMAEGAVKLWRDGIVETVVAEIPDERGNRFNDVIADPGGRVFCGTMSTPDRAGRLYRLDTDRKLTQVLDGIGTSNGIGFTPDRRGMYYTDTPTQEICLFDYDAATGSIENKRVFVRVEDGEGRPDGMTVDSEGCVWSAMWDGYCIVRYSPEGKEIDRVRFPVKKVSSLTFGGDGCGEAYVTTAGGNDRQENGELAGSLFRLDPGTKGVPEFFSRVQ